MALAPDGTLVAALADGRLLRASGSTLSLLAGGARVIERPIRALTVDARQRIWFGGASGLCFVESAAPGAASASCVLTRSVRVLATTPDGRVWAGTEQGLFRQSGASFERVGAGHRVTALTRDPAGGLWALSRQPEPVFDRVAPEGAPAQVTMPAGESPGGDFAVGADGALWVAVRMAVLRLHDGRADRVPLAFSAQGVLVDREGGLWVSTFPGVLARLGQPQARVIALDEGRGAGAALSVLAARDGSVWTATDESLVRIRGTAVERLGPAELPGLSCPRALAEDAGGTLWVSNCYGKVFHLHDGTLSTFAQGEGLPKAHFDGIAVDRDGVVWVGANGQGLFVLRDGRFRREPLLDTDIRCLFASRTGGLWVGSSAHGLVRLAGGRMRRFGAAEGLGHPFVNAIYEARDGALWVGTRGGGLFRMTGDRLRAVDRAAGFPSDNVDGLVEDGRGDLWVTTDAGLFRLPLGALQAYLAGSRPQVHVIRYGREDGLASERFSDGFNQPAVRSADGRLWLPTNLGLSAMPPPERDRPPPAPRVVIEEVRLGAAVHPLGSGAALRTEAGPGDVAIRYTAPAFAAPQRLHFQYRLEGRDADWIEAGRERVAHYVALASGRYRFRVRASFDDDPALRVVEAALPLTLERPLRAWVTPLGVLALAGALAFAVQRLRVRQVRRRFDTVLAERNRIARDLHDSLAQAFAGIGYQLDHLDRTLREAAPEPRRALERLRALVRAGRLEARQAIWNLRAEGPDHRPLDERLRETAQQARLSSAASVELKVEGAARPLSAAVEQELIGVAQEAVTNALVHGQAHRVDIVIAFAERGVRLSVHDDGAGFEVASAPTPDTQHFGLAGMRERAGRIGATLEIRSTPGQGTDVTVQVGGEA
jgi:signal transduction histidine kinase/ligand-binding sensor domain-containing protein